MAQYRFVGSYARIYDTPYTFTRFGQLVELPDDVAKAAIEGGVHILPAAEFDELGITADELKRYGDVASHASAPADFIAKRKAAWGSFDAEQRQLRLARHEDRDTTAEEVTSNG